MRPIARHYQADLFTAMRFLTLAQAEMVMQRAKRLGKPCKVIYLSDFDPAGSDMPISFARKLEKLQNSTRYAHIDVQLHRVILTREQVEELDILRMPIESKEEGSYATRKLRFEEMHGAGGAELDALEEQYPGKLREIVSTYIEDNFYDTGLWRRHSEANEAYAVKVKEANEKVKRERRQAWDDLKSTYEALASAFKERLQTLNEEVKELQETIEDELNKEAPTVLDYDQPEVEEPISLEDPLFDSSRDFREQLPYYKEAQGKPEYTPAGKRGRPRKVPTVEEVAPKRGRGRPKKAENNEATFVGGN